MNDKDRMPKPVENANDRKESQAENAPMPKKECRDSSSKDVAHGRPGAQNKQDQALTADRSQAGQVDREHDGSSHDDKPSQPGKPVAKDTPGPVDKPSQPTNESKPAKPRKAKNHDSFYLGLASAVLVAALGLSLSTMPIFGKHQNAIVIAWIIASMIETLAAFALIYHHNPMQAKPKDPAANEKHEGNE